MIFVAGVTKTSSAGVTNINFKNLARIVWLDAGKALIRVGLSPSKKNCFICFNESSLKVMKNAFYFISRALFVLKIFRFFVRVEKTA